MSKLPKLSVCMITYAHENYIYEAIEGVLMQKCNFEIELIIANDSSPDKTDEIIRKIIKNDPRASIIKYIKQDKNIGMMPNFIFALQKSKGEYVALCEGDDYWTDPLKLQKQVDFLEDNHDYVLSFHKVNILKTDGDIVDDFITNVPENYETLETLARLGNYIHTPSVVFRNVIKVFPFEFELTPIGDFFLYMMLAEHGKLKYFEDAMVVYRYGVGIHSANSRVKMANVNFKLFTLLLSYSNNKIIKAILLERQLGSFNNLEKIIRSEYSNSFVSHNIFFKVIKNLKQPKKIWNKLSSKFKKRK